MNKLKMNWSFPQAIGYSLLVIILAIANSMVFGLIGFYLYDRVVNGLIKHTNLKELGYDVKLEMDFGDYIKKIWLPTLLVGVIFYFITLFSVMPIFGAAILSVDATGAADAAWLGAFMLWFLAVMLLSIIQSVFTFKIAIDGIVSSISIGHDHGVETVYGFGVPEKEVEVPAEALVPEVTPEALVVEEDVEVE